MPTGRSVQIIETTCDHAMLLQSQPGVLFTAGGSSSGLVITIDDANQYQQMDGFGGSLTDSSAWLIWNKLNPPCSGITSSTFAGDLVWNAEHLLIGSTRNWSRSVCLWNLALDQNSGPRNGTCSNCRGVVTIDDRVSPATVTLNVEYYILGQQASPGFFGGINVVATYRRVMMGKFTADAWCRRACRPPC